MLDKGIVMSSTFLQSQKVGTFVPN